MEIRGAPAQYRATSGPGQGPGIVEGVAIRYGDTAILGPRLFERIEPGAFGDTLKRSISADLMHDIGVVLARSPDAGLTLDDTAYELRATLELPDTGPGRDAAELARTKRLSGLSVSFDPVEHRFERAAQGVILVHVKATLRRIALVDDPAYKRSTARLVERAAAMAADGLPAFAAPAVMRFFT